jgi:hypothetical protein
MICFARAASSGVTRTSISWTDIGKEVNGMLDRTTA